MIIMQRLDKRQKVDKPFFDYVARTSPRCDAYEKNDLKAQHPETVKQLLKKLEAWQKSLPAKPEGNLFSAERD